MKIKCTICNALVLLLLCSCVVCFGASEPAQDDAIGIVLDILRSGDQEMQAVAIAMVKEMSGTEVTEALAKELPKLSAASQVMLLSALSDRGDAAALPAVSAAAKSKNPSVRIAALRALGQLGGASSIELLAQAAASATGEERKAARDSLYRLRGPDVDQVILATIPKAEPKMKVELIDAVGERNVHTGVSVLLKTAKDSDRKVRIQSLRVLKVVAGPVDMPALVELLINAQSSSDRNEAQKTIAAVAHKIEDENRQAEAVLIVLPKVKPIPSRCSLLSVLGKIGDNTALPVLTAALKEKNTEVQTAAIRALAEWPTPKPLADLLKVAESSANKVHRILALRGFVRLLGLENERSADELLDMYKKAMSLAPDTGEKRRVLSGLGNVQSLAALTMAAGYLDDKSLSREASSAAVKIASDICDKFPKEANDVLKKIITQTKETDPLRVQAQEVIDKIKQP
ncbi:HEAT repeat domain-containing protein [Planctomycetota bacterium]